MFRRDIEHICVEYVIVLFIIIMCFLRYVYRQSEASTTPKCRKQVKYDRKLISSIAKEHNLYKHMNQDDFNPILPSSTFHNILYCMHPD
jgi:hypothetical protein